MPLEKRHFLFFRLNKMMKKIYSFEEFVLLKEGARNSSSKTGLYPLGYGGIGLYPLADYLTHAADAVVYVTQDERLYHNGDKAPFDITHLPGHKQYGDAINNGDKAPFCIDHLPPPPAESCKMNVGDKKPFKIDHLPGKPKPFKGFTKLVQDPKMISHKSKNMPKA
jgi:hypothetical protein